LTWALKFEKVRTHTDTKRKNMRTKTLILSGVLAALSGASLMAQVYSLNAVGYINVTVVGGGAFTMVTDQLYNGTAVNGVMPAQYLSPMLDSQLLVPANGGLIVYAYDPVNGLRMWRSIPQALPGLIRQSLKGCR
jgi:hypothetical protein